MSIAMEIVVLRMPVRCSSMLCLPACSRDELWRGGERERGGKEKEEEEERGKEEEKERIER